MQLASDFKPERGRVMRFATKGATPEIRQGAWAARAMADGSIERALPEASANASNIVDLLGGHGLAPHRLVDRLEAVGQPLDLSDDPAGLAALWERILDLPLAKGGAGEPQIRLQNGVIRFVPAADGRGPGVGARDLKAADRAQLLAAARARGCEHREDHVVVCGTRINLV